MNYGEKLKELREEYKVSQQVIADSIGIKRSSYNQFEQQYDLIPTIRLNQIANYFNVSIDYILGLNKNPKYQKSNTELNIVLSKERLKQFRKKNKLTQVKLANILQSSQHVIVCYESGKNFIAIPYLYTICKKYHLSADYLLGKIEEPQELP